MYIYNEKKKDCLRAKHFEKIKFQFSIDEILTFLDFDFQNNQQKKGLYIIFSTQFQKKQK
jgi:hypothetical protein